MVKHRRQILASMASRRYLGRRNSSTNAGPNEKTIISTPAHMPNMVIQPAKQSDLRLVIEFFASSDRCVCSSLDKDQNSRDSIKRSRACWPGRRSKEGKADGDAHSDNFEGTRRQRAILD